MTYFEELSRYTFDSAAAGTAAAKNVGWLAANQDFRTGEPRPELLDALWEYCSVLVVPTRGLHSCELCLSPSNMFVRHGTGRLLGSGEIRVFSSDGDVFAAPNLIYHYMLDHHYWPPDEFLRAVEEGPRPGGDEYRELLGRLAVSWRENCPVSPDEPKQIQFVRTETGVERKEKKGRS